jgi:hypothetical protein
VASTEPTLDQLLEMFPAEIGELARRADRLIRSVMPDAAAVVSLGWKNVRYGPGPKVSMNKIAVVLNPLKDHLNLNFGDYETLLDPGHLLEGTGKGIRHVKIRTASDLDRPGVEGLLKAAGRRAGLTP